MTIEILRKDGSTSTYDIQGSFWNWRTFVCFKQAGEEKITYVPSSEIDEITAPDPS